MEWETETYHVQKARIVAKPEISVSVLLKSRVHP